MKQGKLRDFYNWIDTHLGLLNDHTIPYAGEGFHYILAVDSREDTLEQLQERVDQKTKERIMSAAERLIQQGRQQGIEKTAQQMLQDKMPKEQISKWTGLELKQIDKLAQESLYNEQLAPPAVLGCQRRTLL